MTIAEVSRAYGLTADTLRYYERVGLLPHVHRNQSGIRDYTEQDCGWVEFIKCMRGADPGRGADRICRAVPAGGQYTGG